MRLLQWKSDGNFSLSENLIHGIPPYAILSHTWGADTDEVTLQDLTDGTGKHKVGYKKIQFCAEQARRDHLQYFWVDTCCIDKFNAVELQEAINSMFRWYQDAAKCYIYLSDIWRLEPNANDERSQWTWESDLRKSRWFTRGWTLQELLAPASVEFFSKDSERIGDKNSLGRHVSEITGIPLKALQGSPLSSFSITERISWQATRKTTRQEDKVYSLLGICGVYMPLIYGEGEDNAFRRLKDEINRALKGYEHEDFSVAFSLSNVPEINYFVAREQELEEIHRELSGNGSRHVVVLHGLGGIGKTQLTIAYAKRHKDNYSAIFWLNIKDEDSLKQSFARVARQILQEYPSASRLSSIDIKENLDEVVDAVKAWLNLRNNTRWLMIYDNYDNPKFPGDTDPAAVDICKYLPESYQGSVIVTTRSSQVAIGHLIQIKKLKNIRDSLEILSKTSKREELINDPDAEELGKELDGLPLALATAGAYLHQVAMSYSDYLRLYKTSWVKLQKLSPSLYSYENRTLYSTWQISFEHVKRRNELSAKLLHLWAYFDNQDIWFELLQHSDSVDAEWLYELTKDELSFHAAAQVLSEYGLVEVDISSQELVESRGYSIHGCVHSWTIDVLNQEWDYDLARLVLKFIALHIPGRETNKWSLTQRRLLQHAARCSDLISNGLVIVDGIEWTCHNLGDLYSGQGKLDEAEKMYEQALQGKEKALGLEHPSTLDTINNLAILYTNQGKLDEAEKMYERALQGTEKALGPEHTSTLDTVNNLAILYWNQRKLDEAEKMYERALQGREKALGPEHTSTLETVNNLAILYRNQGKLDEAEKMYERALQGTEKALGPEHTSTLDTVNNLAILYWNQGKLDEAEKMLQRALQGTEKALGPEHTSTLSTANNLAILYWNQGKLDEAEKMFERALQGTEKALGPEHTSTLSTVNNLAILYSDQGKLDEAEKMFERALQGTEKALGPEHTSTLETVNNLAILYSDQGKLDEAEKMYERVLQGREKALGPEHTSTLDTVNNLAVLYRNQGKLDEAEKMYERALQGKEKALGAEHPSTLRTVNNLANLYRNQGKLDEAEKMYERALQGKEKALSPEPDGEALLSTLENGRLKSKRHRLFRKLGFRK